MNSNHYLLQKLLNSSSSNSGQNGSSEAEISNLDSFIAGTLSSLGAQRRNACAEELHGILPAESQESPASILVSMQVMDHLLNAIGQGTAYETAKAMDQAFATDKAFQMKFLRANKYDPKKATDQIIRFFKMKLDLFGIEKLAKVITLEDLDENDMDCLRNGSFQVLPCKDMAGRPIIFGMTSLRTCKTMKNELRARWYMLMSVLENQDCQVARVILVAYAVGNLRDKRVGDPDNVEMCNSLPIQFSGTHLCCDDIGQYLLLSSSIRLFQPENRARFRVHYGNHKKVQQVLTTYGIPVSALPLTRDHNTPVLGKHLEWIAKRKAIEKERESRAPTARIDTNGGEISKGGSNQ